MPGSFWLDAGHGGRNPGAICDGLEEAVLNEHFVDFLGQALSAEGIPVEYCRKAGTTVSWGNRMLRAIKAEPRLIFCVHHDFSPGNARGPRVYHRDSASAFEKHMAAEILQAWPEVKGRTTAHRAVVPYKDSYPNVVNLLNNYSQFSTLLLEVDFISNAGFRSAWRDLHIEIIAAIVPSIVSAWNSLEYQVTSWRG